MNSRERVKAALHFTKPDRVPIINLMNLRGLLSSDAIFSTIFPPRAWQPGWRENEVNLFPHWFMEGIIPYSWKKPEWAKDPLYKNWKYMPHEELDEWGGIWNVSGKHDTMGHPGRPSLPDWSKVDEYIETYFLDPDDKKRYQVALVENKIFGWSKYRIFHVGWGPFMIASDMRGFTNFLIDHRRNSDKVKYLIGKITDIYVKVMKNAKKLDSKIDGFFLVDDLGTQDRPFMKTGMFEELYQPVYGTLIETAHDLGCEFHQHCCGKIDPIIPLFIKWGLDAFEFDSPRMCGYADLRPFRGKMMFWACINIQTIYTRGTAAECEREVWHMVRNLGTPDGGFGAYYYPQPQHIKSPVNNIKAFTSGLKKYGTYAPIPPEWWVSSVQDDAWHLHGMDVVPQLPEKPLIK
ncbi:MAG TPA: uroporphyrinogen decarboxylase family protein [Candidatus Lokiarchaeia archaeon]|nr:uroporphyrinogen decarboxylase family protein [Candidatus Lokiarchaeia archaeon]